MKNTMGFVIFALAVLALLFFLSTGKKVPPVPADALHGAVTTNAECAACHGPGKQAPLKQTHPPKEQCLTCHKMKQV
jgi:mono/diheme cytochrome c family protein